jgi:hypothetical protein
MRLLIPVQAAGHPHRQPLRVGARVGSGERGIGAEGERAVQVVLRGRSRADELVLHAELQIVIAAAVGDEPRHRVVDLPRVVDARLRDRALLIDERQEIQLRGEARLVLPVLVERGVRKRDVLLREVHANRIEPVVRQHRVQRADNRLIDVVLFTRRVLRHLEGLCQPGERHDLHRYDLIELG